jgi:hypothetical protein
MQSNGGGAPAQQSCGVCKAPPHKDDSKSTDPFYEEERNREAAWAMEAIQRLKDLTAT